MYASLRRVSDTPVPPGAAPSSVALGSVVLARSRSEPFGGGAELSELMTVVRGGFGRETDSQTTWTD